MFGRTLADALSRQMQEYALRTQKSTAEFGKALSAALQASLRTQREEHENLGVGIRRCIDRAVKSSEGSNRERLKGLETQLVDVRARMIEMTRRRKLLPEKGGYLDLMETVLMLLRRRQRVSSGKKDNGDGA